MEFWLEMEDNNDVTGPGVGTTEHQLVRVVSKDEKRADLLNMAGDYLGTIGDVVKVKDAKTGKLMPRGRKEKNPGTPKQVSRTIIRRAIQNINRETQMVEDMEDAGGHGRLPATTSLTARQCVWARARGR